MTTFLVGKDLSDAIRSILVEPGVRCAVAFWGAGAEDWVTGAGAKVICNLRSGGTNPFALRKVKAELKRRDDLHAKVYLGSSSAIVASANVSVNGLGLEGVEQAGWIEAGTLVDDVAAISAWFEALWDASHGIKKADWTAAELAWRARSKPTLLGRDGSGPFGAFDVAADILPLVTWVQDGEWSTCEDSIVKHYGGSSADLVRQVEDGIELEHPDDEVTLRNRWVLCWIRGKNGLPRKTTPPWWARTGSTVLKGGFRYENEKKRRDVVMGADAMPPVPFDPAEKRFVAALRTVLSRHEYASLVEEDYAAPWYVPREGLIHRMWSDVKTVYLSTPS